MDTDGRTAVLNAETPSQPMNGEKHMADTPNPNQVTDDQFKAAIFEEGNNLVVDLTGIQEAKFETIPRGIYNAEIDSVEFGMSQNSGAPMLTLQIAITDGQYQGRKLPTYWSFSQKALPFTKAAINRVAPEILTSKFAPQQVADEGRLLGKPCRIRVNLEDYQGEPRSRITQILPAEGGQAGNGAAGSGAQAKGFF
jgi:Protein of unknown function (DUF669)